MCSAQMLLSACPGGLTIQMISVSEPGCCHPLYSSRWWHGNSALLREGVQFGHIFVACALSKRHRLLNCAPSCYKWPASALSQPLCFIMHCINQCPHLYPSIPFTCQVGYVMDGSRKRASALRQVIADAGTCAQVQP